MALNSTIKDRLQSLDTPALASNYATDSAKSQASWQNRVWDDVINNKIEAESTWQVTCPTKDNQFDSVQLINMEGRYALRFSQTNGDAFNNRQAVVFVGGSEFDQLRSEERDAFTKKVCASLQNEIQNDTSGLTIPPQGVIQSLISGTASDGILNKCEYKLGLLANPGSCSIEAKDFRDTYIYCDMPTSVLELNDAGSDKYRQELVRQNGVVELRCSGGRIEGLVCSNVVLGGKTSFDKCEAGRSDNNAAAFLGCHFQGAPGFTNITGVLNIDSSIAVDAVSFIGTHPNNRGSEEHGGKILMAAINKDGELDPELFLQQLPRCFFSKEFFSAQAQEDFIAKKIIHKVEDDAIIGEIKSYFDPSKKVDNFIDYRGRQFVGENCIYTYDPDQKLKAELFEAYTAFINKLLDENKISGGDLGKAIKNTLAKSKIKFTPAAGDNLCLEYLLANNRKEVDQGIEKVDFRFKPLDWPALKVLLLETPKDFTTPIDNETRIEMFGKALLSTLDRRYGEKPHYKVEDERKEVTEEQLITAMKSNLEYMKDNYAAVS